MATEHVKTFDHHSVIFREGDSGDEIYIVHAGHVKLMKQVAHRFEKIAELGKGDLFGEMILVGQGPRTHTAIAIEDGTKLIVMKKEMLQAMLKSDPGIAMQLMQQYAKRLQEHEQRLEKLLREQQALDSGIQDILSHVRKKSDNEEDTRLVFGWLQSLEKEVKLPLKLPEAMIGRADASTHFNPSIDLTNLDPNRTVSRRHARIIHMDEGIFLVEEAGVVNGTLLNGHQLEKGKMTPIHHQDRLQFGKIAFQFILPAKPNMIS